MVRKDLLSRLADAGEEAIGKLAETPGADRVVGAMTSMRDRLDELQKRVRGLDELERRVDALERRVEELSPGSKTPAKRPAARTPAVPKTGTTATPRARSSPPRGSGSTGSSSGSAGSPGS